MQFPINNTTNPAHGQVYRQVVNIVDELFGWVPVLPTTWNLFWKAGEVIRPSEFSKLESAAKAATKAYIAMVPLWESISRNIAVIERNLSRGGGLLRGQPNSPFEITCNYYFLNELRTDIKSLRDELERYIGALYMCEVAAQKKAKAEALWRELGQAEIRLTADEAELRRLHSQTLKKG